MWETLKDVPACILFVIETSIEGEKRMYFANNFYFLKEQVQQRCQMCSKNMVEIFKNKIEMSVSLTDL